MNFSQYLFFGLPSCSSSPWTWVWVFSMHSISPHAPPTSGYVSICIMMWEIEFCRGIDPTSIICTYSGCSPSQNPLKNHWWLSIFPRFRCFMQKWTGICMWYSFSFLLEGMPFGDKRYFKIVVDLILKLSIPCGVYDDKNSRKFIFLENMCSRFWVAYSLFTHRHVSFIHKQ